MSFYTARRFVDTMYSEVEAALAYDRAARKINEQNPDMPARRKFRPNFDEHGNRQPYVKPE